MKIIAETAWHHDGDFTFLKSLVTNIVDKTNTDYVKFHISLDLDEYIHTDHPAYKWCEERMLSIPQWTELIAMVKESGKKIMLLFNDMQAIDFGMDFNPEIVEIHSVCLNDIKLLQHLKSKVQTNTEIVLGVGGSDLYEIEHAIDILDSKNIVLMHGFQNYPTQYHNINLGKIKKIMSLFPTFKHGYADHTAWDNAHNESVTLFGASLGMDYIEKHVTIATGEGRTDWQAAISIEQFNSLKSKIDILMECYGNGKIALNEGEKSYSTFGANKKAAILNTDVVEGQTVALSDFDFKRTGQSTNLSQVDCIQCIGKKYSSSLHKGECLKKTDIA